MVKTLIAALDSSKGFDFDIPVEVLMNCVQELWAVCLRMLGRSLRLKNTALEAYFLMFVKSLRNFQILGLLNTWDMRCCFSIAPGFFIQS